MGLITERVVRLVWGGLVSSLALGAVVLIVSRLRPRAVGLVGLVLPVGTYLGMQYTDTPMPYPMLYMWFHRLQVAGALCAAAAAIGLMLWRRDLDQRWASAMLLVSLIGVWAGPPENDHVLVAGGAAAGALFIAVLRPASINWLGAAGGAGVVAWASVGGGVGRLDPTVAGFFCLGVLPLGLLVPWAVVRRNERTTVGWKPLILGHIVIVGVASRVYGARSTRAIGLTVTLLTVLIVALALVSLSRRRLEAAGSAE